MGSEELLPSDNHRKRSEIEDLWDSSESVPDVDEQDDYDNESDYGATFNNRQHPTTCGGEVEAMLASTDNVYAVDEEDESSEWAQVNNIKRAATCTDEFRFIGYVGVDIRSEELKEKYALEVRCLSFNTYYEYIFSENILVSSFIVIFL